MNRIPIGNGVRKSLEHDHADALTEHRSGRVFVKGSYMSVGGKDHSFLRHVTVAVLEIHADSTRQSQRALTGL